MSMSLHELRGHRGDLDQIYTTFGWSVREVERCGEREDRSWTVPVIFDAGGRRVMDEGDLTPVLISELARVAGLMRLYIEMVGMPTPEKLGGAE